jgi:hypothetical protein
LGRGSKCCGTAKVIACIEDTVVIRKILTHLEEKVPTTAVSLLPDSRAPPQANLLAEFFEYSRTTYGCCFGQMRQGFD